ncbi:hypothetical protein KQI48_05430 [Cellulomonas hominis]|jgi:hypothetical protein|uniref:Uncharacterized protein n=1 Tax=Cellulomonas hominis TaxID=156981 RepID=A0A511FAT0_9CELL|nr:hypothetical protein [Cellulomonas hominis]MBB5472293.1 hypothetical protein [Cellulomonas hominis]MBU5422100.1 hypothetical protein [Cellulomonas hominis]NKY07582.1 hypothetical protein [Cellulomonas hominis]NKY09823.1 hypothetical protein [Cellulomonas hominis]GEL46369.1 hypothetical protein CHO01_14850 [Cellulomonas hominis]
MDIGPALAALLPSIGVGLIFWLVIRALVNADRTERAALARMDAEDAARAEMPEKSSEI